MRAVATVCVRLAAVAAIAVAGGAAVHPSPAGAAAPAPLNSWRPVYPAFSGIPYGIAVAGATMWIADSDSGDLWHSTDGGTTWSLSSFGTPKPLSVAIDPNDPSTVYVGTHDDGVIRSTDGGAHWDAVNTGFDLTDPTPQPPTVVAGLAIDPVTSAVYAAVGGTADGEDVYRSTDGGDDWTGVHAGYGARSISVEPDGTVVAGSFMGVTESADGGDTWSSPGGPQYAMVGFDPTAPSTLYAASPGDPHAVGVSIDGGDTWSGLPSSPGDPESLLVTGNAVYVGNDQGLSWSFDGGDTWQISTPVATLRPTAIAVLPGPADTLLIGSGIYGMWNVTIDPSAPGLDAPFYNAGTTAATEITPTSAVLTGTTGAALDLGSPHSTWCFDWGTTSAFGHTTPCRTETEDLAEHGVSALLTGLQPGTTYHYRLVSTADVPGPPAALTSRPDDVTFTTAPAVPPSIRPPVLHLATGEIASGRVPTDVTWTTAAGTYPACRARLRQSIDGRAFAATAPQPRLHAQQLALAVTPGSTTHRFQAAPDDCHGTTGVWATGIARRVLGLQETAFTRSGSWQRTAGGSFWGGTAITTTRAGSSAHVRVTAAGVGVVVDRGRTGGLLRIVIDGRRAATISLRATAFAPHRVAFVRNWLTVGVHTVTVVSLGHGPVALDGLDLIR